MVRHLLNVVVVVVVVVFTVVVACTCLVPLLLGHLLPQPLAHLSDHVVLGGVAGGGAVGLHRPLDGGQVIPRLAPPPLLLLLLLLPLLLLRRGSGLAMQLGLLLALLPGKHAVADLGHPRHEGIDLPHPAPVALRQRPEPPPLPIQKGRHGRPAAVAVAFALSTAEVAQEGPLHVSPGRQPLRQQQRRCVHPLHPPAVLRPSPQDPVGQHQGGVVVAGHACGRWFRVGWKGNGMGRGMGSRWEGDGIEWNGNGMGSNGMGGGPARGQRSSAKEEEAARRGKKARAG